MFTSDLVTLRPRYSDAGLLCQLCVNVEHKSLTLRRSKVLPCEAECQETEVRFTLSRGIEKQQASLSCEAAVQAHADCDGKCWLMWN